MKIPTCSSWPGLSTQVGHIRLAATIAFPQFGQARVAYAIHVLNNSRYRKTWMPGPRPGMTIKPGVAHVYTPADRVRRCFTAGAGGLRRHQEDPQRSRR